MQSSVVPLPCVDDFTDQLREVIVLGMNFNPPISKLLTSFATYICMVETALIIKAGQVMRMVYAVVSVAQFSTHLCARPEDMPYFKGGGMLGLSCVVT